MGAETRIPMEVEQEADEAKVGMGVEISTLMQDELAMAVSAPTPTFDHT